MTVITVSTVGFGEVKTLSAQGQIFTSFLIITTFGTFAYTISNLTRYVLSGQYKMFSNTFRYMTALERLEHHVIVCG